MRRMVPFLLALGCGGAGAPPGRPAPPDAPDPAPPARFTNPVLDRDFPDPATYRAPDGTFYAYATQTGGDRGMVNVQAARSHDLVTWELLGEVMPDKPAWARSTQDFWAPHLHVAGGAHLLYYSAKPDGDDGMCIGVARGTSPAGPFRDDGKPILCGKGIEVIDPFPFDDPATGKSLLYWGSGGAPIFVRELDETRTAFAPGSAAVALLRATPGKAFESLLEGPWVHLRDGTYYLYYSGDDCCGNGSPRRPPRYATMVARSRSATGPFTPMGHLLLGDNGRWLAPGHNAIVTDDAGVDWIVYHAMDVRQPLIEGTQFARRSLLIDRVAYDADGWPAIAGDSASVTPQDAPVVRERARALVPPGASR
ncbi:MAG TPA: glycoside hydrolase family 43 protein [Kofleriaceae bacterium]|nr:glycoside hydrolase family 43 protein [Kofleriaceae bacterium]